MIEYVLLRMYIYETHIYEIFTGGNIYLFVHSGNAYLFI